MRTSWLLLLVVGCAGQTSPSSDVSTDSHQGDAIFALDASEPPEPGDVESVLDVIDITDVAGPQHTDDAAAVPDTAVALDSHSVTRGDTDTMPDVVPDVVPDVMVDASPETTVDDIWEPETPPEPLPYPTRDPFRLKGIQPDFWPDLDEIANQNVGSIAMNFVWSHWEGSVQSPPCGGNEQAYDGHCFLIDPEVDEAVAAWTERGVHVTGIVYGVPSWARQGIDCSPVVPGFEVFCAPDDAADYGRFAGMLASRYDGLGGHGRVIDFVIHNEVNTNDWFDIGCGQGTPCNQEAWIDTYADNYNAAYDAITASQPEARVLVSLTHYFDTDFDLPADANPKLSVKTFMLGLDARVGDRALAVAHHPYAPSLLSPEFSADDLPKVTYGNIGAILGWFAAAIPNRPSLMTMQLTESGINSIAPHANEADQDVAVCDGLRNIVGTPGIENYIYHRMRDHPVEVAAGLGLGLRRPDGSAKPAWTTWAMANRNDLSPPQLDCGFEDLPYVRLRRSFLSSRGHWASTRIAPPGFVVEQSYRLLRAEEEGTHMLYECAVGTHNMLTTSPNCEGQVPLGPVGWIYDAPVNGTVALYRCYLPGVGDHFISPDPDCEGQTTESLLGYALP